MFDSYNVKKVLPRLVIAVILIQLSWFIFTGLIRLTAILAYGLEGLMYAPFGGRNEITFSNILSGTDGGNGIFLVAAAAGAAAAVILGVVFSFALMALIGLLIGFTTLLIRQVVLLTLLVLSPLALVAWILPGTQKFWKIWWESFSKLLLMFPMVIVLVAGGRIIAFIAGQASKADTESLLEELPLENVVFLAIIAVCYFGPFFLIPKTFQVAGSAFANITGMVNDRSRGVFDRIRKSRQERSADRVKRAGANSLWNQNRGGLGGKFAKKANTLASWAVSPGSNLAYKYRNVPGFSGAGSNIAEHIDSAAIDQTQKLFQELNQNKMFNDVAYRTLGGMHGGLSKSVQDRLKQENLYGHSLTSRGDILKASNILRNYGEKETEQIGANALEGSAGRIGNLYSDAEMNKASVAGAAAMGLAAHGFASGEDISQVGNEIMKKKGRGVAQRLVSAAQVTGQKSRPDIKAGYGVLFNEGGDGRFTSGLASPKRAKSLAKTLGVADWMGAKPQAVQAMAPTNLGLVSTGRQAQVQREELKQNLRAQGVTEEQAMQDLSNWRNDDGESFDEIIKTGKSMEEVILQGQSPFSSSDLGSKTEWKKLADQVLDPREVQAFNDAMAAQSARGSFSSPGTPGGEGGSAPAAPAE